MVFDMPSCGGCRTCELACSFHHRKEFNPTISSIKIMDKEDKHGFLVLLVEKNDAQSMACDGCRNLEIPLCIQYCREKEDLEEILKAFMEKSKP